MINILRIPDDVRILTSRGEIKDSKVRFDLKETQLDVYLSARQDNPEFVLLRWNHRTVNPVKVMGDKWERAYSDMSWGPINPDKFMPWYFMIADGKNTTGCGVKVRPKSFVSFEYDSSGISAWFDVRCGAVGVELDGREILIGSVVCENYNDISAFKATQCFCKKMCDDPIFPDKPIYGGNNWYYAYGESSYEEAIMDAQLQAELAEGLQNPPSMVIDDGWSMNVCAGPWLPNEKFVDMAKIADEYKKLNVIPGLWIRLLHDIEFEENNKDCLLNREGDDNVLDPSHPKVKDYLRQLLQRIKGWGYEILKHDYSTFDMFGDYGKDLNGTITKKKNWSFYDRKKTSAEIVLDFYKLIYEEFGDRIIIGCNTVSHLCAGLAQINRIGDDTSGKYWDRTRALGVNSLAFRLPQNDAFYKIDADCVGILKKNIPWELNKQWMDLLSVSNSPLFISCPKDFLNQEQIADVKKAFKINSVQMDTIEPLDWEYNVTPQTWKINGEITEFDWVGKEYPDLLEGNAHRMI